MARSTTKFSPNQQMHTGNYEIQHKLDTYLNHVELHHHDFYEIFYLVSGDVEYIIEGKVIHVQPGDLLLVSPKELHQASIGSENEAYERYVLWINKLALDWLSSEEVNLEDGLNPVKNGNTNLIRLKTKQQEQMHELMETLYQENGNPFFGSQLMCQGILLQLLVYINRLAAYRSYDEDAVDSNELVMKVVNFVNSHFCERLTLENLATQFYVSKYHLSHKFRKYMGTGVYKYILKKRLQMAKLLLADGEHLGNVSTKCGFADYAGFYRAFISEYGLAPREYLETVLKQE